MEKNLPLHLQEIIFSSSTPYVSRAISQLYKKGELRKIAPKIFTPNLTNDPAEIIKRNAFRIIGHLYPGIQLSHRSAFEFKPTSNGNLFLTYRFERRVKLPGLTLNIMKGSSAVEGDYLFTESLNVSSEERAMLENLQESRKRGDDSKTVALPELEERLEKIVRVRGEEGLNEFRDKARKVAGDVDMEREFARLDKIIGALLHTRPNNLLSSPLAIARAFGNPYDRSCISLFEKLFIQLQQQVFSDQPDANMSLKAFHNFAFYEAYFSNFIEGTRFKLEDAQRIIETGEPMPSRDEDSHDILGTYQIVSNREEMQITPSTAEELIGILKYRQQIMLAARQSKNPGEFKTQNNHAGGTEFVDHTLVRGTFHAGFDFYRALQHPFAKAAYMMFFVSEIHPFADGNGRMARIMMNAELVKADQTKIIIPTVFREDYIGALRILTLNKNTDTYIRMLTRARLFSNTLVGEDTELMYNTLIRSDAFKEGNEYILKIIQP